MGRHVKEGQMGGAWEGGRSWWGGLWQECNIHMNTLECTLDPDVELGENGIDRWNVLCRGLFIMNCCPATVPPRRTACVHACSVLTLSFSLPAANLCNV